MNNGYATLRCTLKVYPRCNACKWHTMEILGSIVGTYDLTINAERGTATIVGQVDPNFCIKAIARCNGHAELVWANLSHPRMRERSYAYDYGSSSYYDGISYGPRRSLPGMYHEYPTRSIPEYSYNGNYGYDYDYDSVYRRNPNYPRIDYTIPYQGEESMSLCSIM